MKNTIAAESTRFDICADMENTFNERYFLIFDKKVDIKELLEVFPRYADFNGAMVNIFFSSKKLVSTIVHLISDY